MKPPRLEVIDRAIERIEIGLNRMACVALWHAASEVERCCSHWRGREYSDQFERFVTSNFYGPWPSWWNSSPDFPGGKQARIQALRGFRQACIDAAKGVRHG